MPSDAVATLRAPDRVTAAELVARRMALRIAVGVVLGFVLGGLTGTAFFFFPPLMAAQFLVTMRQPPALREGIVIVALAALLSGIALIVAAGFSGQPVVYLLLIGLLLFLGFLLDTAGKALPATLLLTLAVTVPLVATQSVEAAAALAAAFTEATALGVLVAWAMFAAFPASAMVGPASPVHRASAKAAPVNTAILLPVLALFMMTSRMTFVALMVIIAVIRLRDRGGASGAVLGLLVGNVLGGIVASIAYGFVSVQPGAMLFLLIVLFVGLMFAAQIASNPARAPIFAIALVTFVILLGIGVSPLPMESGEAFTTRLWNVLLAAAYAVGAISLIPLQRSAPRPPDASGI